MNPVPNPFLFTRVSLFADVRVDFVRVMNSALHGVGEITDLMEDRAGEPSPGRSKSSEEQACLVELEGVFASRFLRTRRLLRPKRERMIVLHLSS